MDALQEAASLVACLQDPMHTPKPRIAEFIGMGIDDDEWADWMVVTFCGTLEPLLVRSECLWDPQAADVAPRCLALFHLIIDASSGQPRLPECLLRLCGFLLSLLFRAGGVPGGQEVSGTWTLAGNTTDYLASLSEHSSSSHAVSLTKFLDLLHAHSDLQDEGAWTATAHAFVVLSRLPGIVNVVCGNDSLLRVLNKVLSIPAPIPRLRTKTHKQSPYPFTRLQYGTLCFIRALVRLDQKSSVVPYQFIEHIPDFGEKLHRMMSWFVEDAIWIHEDDCLDVCTHISDGLRRPDWLQQWIRSVVRSAQSKDDDTILRASFQLSRGPVKVLLENENLFGPDDEPPDPFWRSVEAQCVVFMSLFDAWKYMYSGHSFEDLSRRMITQLALLQDSSTLLLENYIDEALELTDSHVSCDSVDLALPPLYLADLMVALQAKETRIEELKALLPPIHATSLSDPRPTFKERFSQ